MKILTTENLTFELDSLTEKDDRLIHYMILDFTDPKNIDFYSNELIHMQSYNENVVDISIGKYNLNLPLDWAIMIADYGSDNLEAIEISKINERPFKAFCINPISSFLPEFLPITLNAKFSPIIWNYPMLKANQALVLPLETKEKPMCALIMRTTHRLPDCLNIASIFS